MTSLEQLQPFAKPAAAATVAGGSCYAIHSAGVSVMVILIMFFVSTSLLFILLQTWLLGGRGFGVGAPTCPSHGIAAVACM
jgi:hypothetical protein